MKPRFGRTGLTIVELLVVVTILSIITAMLIPRLRVINKDRAIREAGRVVGSGFSRAIDRALFGEGSGLIIERNGNIIDTQATPVNFAGTRIFLMRRLPPFGGDNPPSRLGGTGNTGLIISQADASSLGLVPPIASGTPPINRQMMVRVDIPLEHTSVSADVQANDREALIKPYDSIRLNNSSVRYPIVRVQRAVQFGQPRLFLTVNLSPDPTNNQSPPVLPDLGAGSVVNSYLIYRQPKVVKNTEIDLPDGYIVDLRFSGNIDPATNEPLFNVPTGQQEDEVKFYFDELGAMESVFNTSTAAPFRPYGPIYLLVTEYDPETAFLPPGDPSSAIYDPASLWVTIDASTGSVNVAYNAPPPTGLSFAETVRQARSLATAKISSNQ